MMRPWMITVIGLLFTAALIVEAVARESPS